jgi:hypothetical protein
MGAALAVLVATACGPAPVVRTVAYQPNITPAISNRGDPIKDPSLSFGNPPPAPTISSVGPDPKRLLGLEGGEIERLFGAASLRRQEHPAQVWQYPGEHCVLHLFLYEKDGDFKVEHYEARNRSGVSKTGGACLASLLSDPDGGGLDP